MTNALSLTAMAASQEDMVTLVTMRIDDQLFGLDVTCVRDVLKQQRIAPIPRAPKAIEGSINLRGKIVTVINLRERLQLSTQYTDVPVFVVVEHQDESYALLVDKAGEVLNIPYTALEKTPANVAPHWQDIAKNVCRLDKELLVIIETQHLLKI
jgi:purine-binding chemotaxis protein CheW